MLKTKEKHGPVVALYGNVALTRAFCPKCDSMAFVVNGKLACCDRPISIPKGSIESIRITSPDAVRHRLGGAVKRQILDEQDNRCFYCNVQFGSIKTRHGNPIVVALNWDHKLPFAYSQNNKGANFVAACHVCNGIKSSRIFQDEDEARVYLATQRKHKGYNW